MLTSLTIPLKTIHRTKYDHCATLSSLKSKFPLSDDFNKLKRTYHVNEIVNRDAFIEYLVHLGYTIAPAVESPFEYCIKVELLIFILQNRCVPIE